MYQTLNQSLALEKKIEIKEKQKKILLKNMSSPCTALVSISPSRASKNNYLFF
jgi:hypothetical protein